jgi:soluble lytic murein transglycosylase-like protein
VFVESTFRERAVSHVGARGLAQVMPRTARWLEPSVSTGELFDPEVNLELGFRYLRQMIDRYDGDLFKALTAYNRGPGTVDRILRRGGNPDNGYARKVMEG